MRFRHLVWAVPGLVLLLLVPGVSRAAESRPADVIVFHAGGEGRQRLVRWDVVTGEERDLTERVLGLGNPSAAALGRVVFQRAGDIWMLEAATGHAVNLTHTEHYEGCPWMSGDGTRIAFDGIRAERSEIFLMAGNGSGVRQLTRGPGNNA